uniref:Basic proline-rich protein-like n=1 Tax=Phascolarctos cinereus TaxID=38626 RepID=A0A6P5ILV4_PHACI|nr:basic proline-rich protein-like [Phascolarctos cinereus]
MEKGLMEGLQTSALKRTSSRTSPDKIKSGFLIAGGNKGSPPTLITLFPVPPLQGGPGSRDTGTELAEPSESAGPPEGPAPMRAGLAPRSLRGPLRGAALCPSAAGSVSEGGGGEENGTDRFSPGHLPSTLSSPVGSGPRGWQKPEPNTTLFIAPPPSEPWPFSCSSPPSRGGRRGPALGHSRRPPQPAASGGWTREEAPRAGRAPSSPTSARLPGPYPSGAALPVSTCVYTVPPTPPGFPPRGLPAPSSYLEGPRSRGVDVGQRGRAARPFPKAAQAPWPSRPQDPAAQAPRGAGQIAPEEGKGRGPRGQRSHCACAAPPLPPPPGPLPGSRESSTPQANPGGDSTAPAPHEAGPGRTAPGA